VVRPVILDFGIAKVLSDAELSASSVGITRFKTKMGTPAYMSPEQVESAQQVDRRTDVWAMGALLYELLTGAQAFTGQSMSAVMIKVARRDFPAPTGVAPALVAIIDKALSLDPEARYPTCRAFREALDAAVASDEALWVPEPVPAPASDGRNTLMDSLDALIPPEVPADTERSRANVLAAALALLMVGAVALAAAAVLSMGDTSTSSSGGATTVEATPTATPAPAATPTATPPPRATPTPPVATPRPTATPQPVPAATPRPPAEPSADQVVARMWKKHAPKLKRTCWASLGKPPPSVWKVRLEVNKDGRVARVDANPAGANQPRVQACIERTIAASNFGKLDKHVRRIEDLRFP
jgi:serine/threonine-protein kinase